MKDDQKNFVIFAVFAALVLIASQFLMPLIAPPPPPAPKVQAGSAQPTPTAPAPAPGDTAVATKPLAQALGESPRVQIETPTLKGSISLKGARIDDLVLSQYRETVSRKSPPVRLLSPAGTPGAYFGTFGWTATGATAPDKNSVWTADRATLTPSSPVRLRWMSPEGVRFEIRFSVDENYMFQIEQSVGNLSAKPIVAQPFSAVQRSGVPKDIDTSTNHIGPVGVFGGSANYDVGYPNLQGQAPGFFATIFASTAKAGPNYFDATGGWLGFADRYWLTALVPDQKAAVHAGFHGGANDIYQADFTTQAVSLEPGKGTRLTNRFFAGAKEVARLDAYQAAGIPKFEYAIDWGWFQIIEKPIFYYLDWLFRNVGNFGVAIILLTITIRALLFPVAQRQFASMANMRVIQPKMKALQERYKDDKAKQQQEVMKLYKEEKVNPLAGCLPVLLQIPIMFALYKVLLLTIEMRHQPFVLWIRDLSAPDPATILNLFGTLPFTPTSFFAIGIIPVLLGVSMFFQMKLNPAPMDDMQKQVFAIMPWMLMFVMAPFAVGLQLYWITSNCITILQQRWLYSRHPALKEPVKKAEATK